MQTGIRSRETQLGGYTVVMANPVLHAPPITWQEFLALEWPHEWVEGVAYAMGATTPRHAQLCARLTQQLPDRDGCSTFAAGLVVYVAEMDRGFLPDVVVICGTPEEAPNKPSGVTNPAMIFEVLSSGTQRFDRTTKLEAYQRLPSLKAYVLLHQDQPKAEVYRRGKDGWTREEQVGSVLLLPGDLSVDLDKL